MFKKRTNPLTLGLPRLSAMSTNKRRALNVSKNVKSELPALKWAQRKKFNFSLSPPPIESPFFPISSYNVVCLSTISIMHTNASSFKLPNLVTEELFNIFNATFAPLILLLLHSKRKKKKVFL